MKIDVDYEKMLDIADKLRDGNALSNAEMKEVFYVLKSIQGDYIPTREELQKHDKNIDLLDKVNIENQSDIYNRIYKEIVEFERKYL